MWLCSSKTLFTKTGDGLGLAYGLQFAGPVADNGGQRTLESFKYEKQSGFQC